MNSKFELWIGSLFREEFIMKRRGVRPRPKLNSKPLRMSMDAAVKADLRQNLRLKVLYDEERIERLIDFERQRMPGASIEALMQAAIERWERENR